VQILHKLKKQKNSTCAKNAQAAESVDSPLPFCQRWQNAEKGNNVLLTSTNRPISQIRINIRQISNKPLNLPILYQ